MTNLNIGFIGLGVMGTPMATHLARAGHRLALHDLDAQRAHALAAQLGGTTGSAAGGAVQVCTTPREVARASEVVITMLPDGEAVQRVALGENGLLHGFAQAQAPGAVRVPPLLLDTSSAEPWLTERTAAALAAAGVVMVDAPVSGAAWGAQAAELVFMVGGADADVARVRPLLDVMGRAVHHLGPLGAGHAMKCLNNTITAVTLLATAEGLAAGKRHGLDPAVMVDVLNDSTGGSWISRTQFHQRIFNRAFDDPFRHALMLKDIGIGVQLGRETATPMPLAALVQQLWRMSEHAAGAGASISEAVRWVESQTGTELTAGRTPR